VRSWGKKIGQYDVTSRLGRYVLDVRIDVATNMFSVLVPKSVHESVDPKRCATYDAFSATSLTEVKNAVWEFLEERDVPDFRDVIEYTTVFNDRRVTETIEFEFDFRVVRVQVGDDPRLSIPVEVSPDGAVEVKTLDGEPSPIVNYHRKFDKFVPYTAARWRKFTMIKDGLLKLRELLHEALDCEEEEASRRLDALEGAERLLLGGKEDPTNQREEENHGDDS